jgi:hypothetical protein
VRARVHAWVSASVLSGDRSVERAHSGVAPDPGDFYLALTRQEHQLIDRREPPTLLSAVDLVGDALSLGGGR